MNALRVSIFLLAGWMLQACATTSPIFADASEPHGIVDLDVPKKAAQEFAAYFLTVDGQNVSQGRHQLLLRPGVHEIRVGAVIDDFAGAISTPGGRSSENPVVTIDVKEGMRYSVSARVEGQRTHEWRAIVSAEAPISGYRKP